MKHRKDILEIIINKMFEIAGHSVTFNDVLSCKDDWYAQYTMTQAQNDEWRAWSKSYLLKKSRYNKYLADREVAMIDLCYGLKFSDPPQ